jgi:hypothetical protein
MTPPHLDARRAAVLFEQLRGRRRPLRVEDLRGAWADEDLAHDLQDADAFPRARRKAVADLRDFGLVIDDGSNGLRLIDQDPATSSVLVIDDGECLLREQIRRLLDQLDPDRGGLSDPRVIVKVHVPRDRLRLGYGEQADPIEGVPYRLVTGDRDRLLIRTDEGDRAVFLDAVRSVRLVKVGADDVRDGEDDPPVIGGTPCAAVVREAGLGRPPTPRQLRDASSIIAALGATRRETDGRYVALDQLVAGSGLPATRVRDLLPVASFLSGLDLCEDPIDEARVVVYERQMVGPRSLNASEALAARLDAGAVRALRGAVAEMGVGLTDEQVERWLAKLDSFLSCASLDSAVPTAWFAPNVVAAAFDGDAISVKVGDAATYQLLKPDGLAWSSYRWWVLGSLNGRDLRRTELALDKISGVLIE